MSDSTSKTTRWQRFRGHALGVLGDLIWAAFLFLLAVYFPGVFMTWIGLSVLAFFAIVGLGLVHAICAHVKEVYHGQ